MTQILPQAHIANYWQSCQLTSCFIEDHRHWMLEYCPSRCQGNPTISALNCSVDNVTDVPKSIDLPQLKLPLCSLRLHSHTPNPSCTITFIRLAPRFVNKYAWWAWAAPNTAMIWFIRVSIPLLMSHGAVLIQMASTRINAAPHEVSGPIQPFVMDRL